MTKASDNAFPSILITEGTEPSAPAAGKQRLYIDSTSHHLSLTNSSGTERDIEAAAGAVATDAIWDTAGDLAVGTGANTAAKLVKGAAGGALSIINGAVAWDSGTSMPASKLTGDRYWRTDLGLEVYWDGAQWLTTTLFRESFSVGSTVFSTTTSGAIAGRLTPWHTTYDMWMVTFYGTTYVAATNNGSLYWTAALAKWNAADSPSTIVSFATSADTQANWVSHTVAVGALLTPATYPLLGVSLTKTSTPGACYFAGSLAYRLVIT